MESPHQAKDRVTLVKLVYIGAEGAFRKILGSVGQKWISEKVSKGRQGVGRGSAGGRQGVLWVGRGSNP